MFKSTNWAGADPDPEKQNNYTCRNAITKSVVFSPTLTISLLAEMKQTTVYIQSNIHLQPPLISEYLPLQLSDQFSKIPKVSQTNPYMLNLLEATTSHK